MRERRGYHAHEDPRITHSAHPNRSIRAAGAGGGGGWSRRDVLRAAFAYAMTGCSAPRANVNVAGGPPMPQWGVQSGDVTASSGVVWCRSDRPAARMMVEWSTSPRFERFTQILGPRVGVETDLVGKVALNGLPSSTRIHYRARFFDDSPWATGSFGTAPAGNDSSSARDVLIAWSGDTNGQGWGIDPARGGMPAYSALLARNPDVFIHCGDAIYADQPIPPTLALADGTVWQNVVKEVKGHHAETLDDFRGAHLYGRHSAEVRALSAACPLLHIWDDHEVRNNWFPGELIDDVAYKERRIDALAIHAQRAMYEHTPTLRDPNVIYRVMSWGPLVDIFLLDGRSYRSPNEPAPPGDAAAFLGKVQSAWLLGALAASKAVWKVIACDMAIGLVLADPGKNVAWANDGWGNENGPPRERELELARLLSELRARKVKNIVFVTADVHYAAAHRFDPPRAAVFKDFDPFWEFIAGPMHATAFPRKPLDDTFGPEVEWASAEPDTPFGTPAVLSTQSFGLLRVDGKSHELTVTFVDGAGRDLHRVVLRPA